ncbi:MAG: O-antigen ligase family protein [Candidatus Omnitrophica bacterium]|nr:O-antigen ligase family protein [Candidatus Omnitrophota bacterium]
MPEESTRGGWLTQVEGRALLFLLVAFPFRETLAGWWVGFPLALTGLAFLILLAHAFSISPPPRAPRPRWPLVALAAWVVISAFRAPDWDRAFGLLEVWGLSAALGWVAANQAKGNPRFPLKVCLALWACASFIAAFNPGWQTPLEEIEKAIQSQVIEEDFKQAILHAAAQGRLHFPFGNPIDLGLFLTLSLLSLPVLVHEVRKIGGSPLFTFGLILSAGVQVYVLWGTRSRTPLLGLIGGIGIWMLRSRVWRGHLLIGALVGVLLLGGLLAVSPGGREMLGRSETVHARLIYWKAAARMIREAPLLGQGVGGYGSNYPRFRELTPHQTLYPHNLFLEVMADMGAVGLLLLLVAMATIIPYLLQRAGLCRLSRDGVQHPFVESLHPLWGLSAATSFLLSSQVGFHHDMLYLLAPAGILAGATLSSSRSALASPPGATRGRPLLLRIALLLFAFVALAREIGHFSFEKAQRIFENRGDIREGTALLRRATTVWPPLWEARAYLGGMAIDLGDEQTGMRLLRESIRWSPTTPNLHSELATVLWDRDEKEEALLEIERAISLHPVKWAYHDQKSRWLHSLGRAEEARAEKSLALELQAQEPKFEEALQAIRAKESP